MICTISNYFQLQPANYQILVWKCANHSMTLKLTAIIILLLAQGIVLYVADQKIIPALLVKKGYSTYRLFPSCLFPVWKQVCVKTLTYVKICFTCTFIALLIIIITIIIIIIIINFNMKCFVQNLFQNGSKS